jgi:hypothetical protein
MSTIKNGQLFVQVGFPKTATTTLQREIYPLLCKYTKYSYWREDPNLEHLISTSKFKASMAFQCERIEIPEFTLVSLESLMNTDPRRWESQGISNRETFGEDAHILIVLREPRSYLSSLYTELCLHSGLAQRPEHFFMRENEYSEHFMAPIFSIDEFSYKRIIDIYRKLFKMVTVVKLERLPKLDFVNDFFDIDDVQLANMKNRFEIKRHNRGFSERSVKTLFFLNRVAGLVGFSFGLHPNNSSVDSLRNTNIEGPEGPVRSRMVVLTIKLLKRNLKRLNWYLVLKAIDRVFPSKKFELNFDELPYINIDKLDVEYIATPEYKTYSRE